jgi:hypothetical protein
MLMSDIGRFHVSGIAWPDLTVPHFFLWGYLKELVCRNRPHTIHAIWGAIAIINQELLRRDFENLVTRLGQDVANEGHLQDVVYEKYYISNKLLIF